jgi:hypothetical protein
LNPISTDILAVIGAIFGGHTYYYRAPADVNNLQLAVDVVIEQQTKVANRLLTRADLDSLPKSAISGEHHIHFTAREVFDTLRSSLRERIEKQLHLPADSTTTFAGGYILWLASIPSELEPVVNWLDISSCSTMADFAVRAKALSVRAKSLQNIVNVDLRSIFEVDVLINRIVGSVDWAAEKQNRVQPNTADVDYDTVYERAVRLFAMSTDMASRPKAIDWKKFWHSRWQWSAAGSVHSQYHEDTKFLAKDRDLRNKFIVLNAMPDRPFEYFMQRNPAMQAWASTKYEWGKQRAIYGVDLTNYVLTSFAFYGCEDTLPAMFPVGRKARPSYVASKVAAVIGQRLPLALDYADFNSQHSLPAMRAVLTAWLDVHKSTLTHDQVQAGLWCIKALDDVTIHDTIGLKESYNAAGTLLSGWRLTTFVNSVLNKIYTDILFKGYNDHVDSVHNGDDVLLGVTKPSALTYALRNAKEHNIRLQTSKSAYGAIAEFLRVDHRRGEHGQYLARNIATLMHARIESKKAITPIDAQEAMDRRLEEFVLRGGDHYTAIALRKTYYTNLSRVFDTDEDLLYLAREVHRVSGGLSEAYDARTDWELSVLKTGESAEIPMRMPGIADYANEIRAELHLSHKVEDIAQHIYQATVNAVRLVKKQLKARPQCDVSTARTLKGVYKAYANIAGSAVLGKGLMTGFVVDVLSQSSALKTLGIMAGAAIDPIRYITTVT